jgi:hypothetical protein
MNAVKVTITNLEGEVIEQVVVAYALQPLPNTAFNNRQLVSVIWKEIYNNQHLVIGDSMKEIQEIMEI